MIACILAPAAAVLSVPACSLEVRDVSIVFPKALAVVQIDETCFDRVTIE